MLIQVKNTLQKLKLRAAAWYSVAVINLISSEAWAQSGGSQNATDVLRFIGDQVVHVVPVIRIIAWVGAFFFAGSGIRKLKDFSDNPGQNKMQDWIVRFVVAGLLLMLDYIIATFRNSITGGNGNTTITAPSNV